MRTAGIVGALAALAMGTGCADSGTGPAKGLDGRYELTEWSYSWYGISYPVTDSSYIRLVIRGDSVTGSAALAIVVADGQTEDVLGSQAEPQLLRGTWYERRDGRIGFEFAWEAGGDTWFALLPWEYTSRALVHDTRSPYEVLHIRLAKVR